MFQLFGELIATHFEAARTHEATQVELAEQRHLAELREQFVAVLGHDLRNPLAAIDAGLTLLGKTPDAETLDSLIALMRGSTRRIAELVANVTDFARIRLGSGLSLNSAQEDNIGPALTQVIDELRSGHPTRRIDLDLRIDRPVTVDNARIGQLLGNLVANALVHGQPDTPVRIVGRIEKATLRLSVVNQGEPIPPEIATDLFKPFVRSARAGGEGLGLGLYIASEIARAHGGSVKARSQAGETVFVCELPLP